MCERFWTLPKGQRLYGVTNARFDHAFGETTLTVPPLGLRRQFFLYSPRRNYYQLQNSIARKTKRRRLC
jgi:hypothetical protein